MDISNFWSEIEFYSHRISGWLGPSGSSLFYLFFSIKLSVSYQFYYQFFFHRESLHFSVFWPFQSESGNLIFICVYSFIYAFDQFDYLLSSAQNNKTCGSFVDSYDAHQKKLNLKNCKLLLDS